VHLGAKQSSVEERGCIQRVKLDGVVIVGHRPEIVIEVVTQESSVDVEARILWLKLYGLVHVVKSRFEVTRRLNCYISAQHVGVG
jgi:hypothetical protein